MLAPIGPAFIGADFRFNVVTGDANAFSVWVAAGVNF
jgi:hypothetical protein